MIDVQAGVLNVEIDANQWGARELARSTHQADNEVGFDRELLCVFHAAAMPAETGTSMFGALIGETARVGASVAHR